MINENIVSVIIPCYNQEKYLAEAIDSVLSQTYTQWEMVIVDDGSTDNSAAIAKQYAEKDCRIKYVFQENAGPSAARNRGVRESTGKYLFFLDGDDKVDSIIIETGVRYMEKHTNCTLFFSEMQYFGELTGKAIFRYTTYKDLLLNNSIDCCCLVHKADFDRVGGFDEMMFGYEDWEFFIRLLYKNDYVYQDPRPLFYYRKANPVSVNKLAIRHSDELTSYIYEKHKEKYMEYWGMPFSAYRNSFYYQTELRKVLNSKSYKLGRKLSSPLSWIKSLFH